MNSTAYNPLTELIPQKKFFIGIDSDGCAFDTMEIKHKECFCPNTIQYWNLQTISKYAREAWEFVNLYSKSRGMNRFLTLIESIRLLSERREVIGRQVNLPDLSSLVKWTQKETKLGNPALQTEALEKKDPVLNLALVWSKAVNNSISEMVHDIPPFPMVRECLEKLHTSADMMVVSSTPVDALKREWTENDIARYTSYIAGQENGSKKEHLALAAKGKYEDDHILMIGDAPGDMNAAKFNKVHFFPIIPGNEDESWLRFYEEGIEKLLTGKYTGDYENALILEFESKLPENPPWQN